MILQMCKHKPIRNFRIKKYNFLFFSFQSSVLTKKNKNRNTNKNSREGEERSKYSQIHFLGGDGMLRGVGGDVESGAAADERNRAQAKDHAEQHNDWSVLDGVHRYGC